MAREAPARSTRSSTRDSPPLQASDFRLLVAWGRKSTTATREVSIEAQVLGAGEAHRTYTARGSAMHFKAVAALDDGDFSLMERTLPPGGRQPPPHRHTNCSEAYFILDGAVTVTIDDRPLRLDREQFVLVPRGVAHTFGNQEHVTARLLVLHAPAMDAYFAALHDLWSGSSSPTTDEERALMSRFGMERA